MGFASAFCRFRKHLFNQGISRFLHAAKVHDGMLINLMLRRGSRMETRCSLFLFPGIYYLFGRAFVLAARLATTLPFPCFCFQLIIIIYSEMVDSGPRQVETETRLKRFL